jgi:hypothetical protein
MIVSFIVLRKYFPIKLLKYNINMAFQFPVFSTFPGINMFMFLWNLLY